jgi:murein DD-endopeptidase MepM/ murein hydrolase activator NlpD
VNLILLSKLEGRARQIDLSSPTLLAAFALSAVIFLGVAFLLGSWAGARWAAAEPEREIGAWSRELAAQRAQIDAARSALQHNVDALAMRVGQMNAHVIRLDALGKRLTQMANLDNGEFNFDTPPPLGGEDAGVAGQSAAVPELTGIIDQLSAQLSDREQQLGALENLILTRNLRREIYPQGRPVESGFISSFYGSRLDPFTGHTAFHAGIDFAGAPRSQVLAVATGVVTFAGPSNGYGNLVEITHGNGYVTRYGHNERILVTVGTTVQKGDAVALMGSTGRSTGTHLHFEVLRNGSAVNPLSFIGNR